jgi:hypothetical protein
VRVSAGGGIGEGAKASGSSIKAFSPVLGGIEKAEGGA